MEQILIIDADRQAGKKSLFPNLALAKIEKYHRDKGDKVIRDFPLLRATSDKVYVSCVFEKNRKVAAEYVADNAIIGGTGWDCAVKLPPEIEAVHPHINLGFTSRGCIRNCPWCVVPKNEGKVRPTGNVLEIWDGSAREIKLLDNNILALPEHFALQCALAKSKGFKIDFNQGLDARLVTDKNARLLSEIRSERLRFSWDNLADEAEVLRGIDRIIKLVPPSRIMVFMLCNFNSTPMEDFYRYERLRALGVDGYVQLYEDGGLKAPRLMKEFQRWANIFKLRGLPFPNFLRARGLPELIPPEFLTSTPPITGKLR